MSATTEKISACRTSFTSDRIHENGARRHGPMWLAANMRAVEVGSNHGMNLQNECVRQILAEVTLRIMDGLQVERGLRWNPVIKSWQPAAAARPVEKE